MVRGDDEGSEDWDWDWAFPLAMKMPNRSDHSHRLDPTRMRCNTPQAHNNITNNAREKAESRKQKLVSVVPEPTLYRCSYCYRYAMVW